MNRAEDKMPETTLVLDTNIYLSAILFGGKPEQIIELARQNQVRIFISEPILAEIKKVLAQKFHWGKTKISTATAEIKSLTCKIDHLPDINIISSDPPDNIILATATASQADFIISGDHHLLDLKHFRNIPILTPSQFFEMFFGDNEVKNKP
jgi:putative PIN family toxin of toxin-antitoxin system